MKLAMDDGITMNKFDKYLMIMQSCIVYSLSVECILNKCIYVSDRKWMRSCQIYVLLSLDGNNEDKYTWTIRVFATR